MQKKYPKVVILPLTYKCNAKCIMCDIWKNELQEELTYKDLKIFFENEVIAQNLLSVNLTGGEPLLRNDLVEIVEMILRACKKLDIITINTNGYFTERYKKIISALCELKGMIRDYKLFLYFSLDGLEKKHDEIRGIDGFFERVQNTFGILEKLKQTMDFSYSVNFTISKANYMEMENVYRYMNSKGIKIDFTYGMESNTYFGNSNNKMIGISGAKEKDFICKQLAKYLEEDGLSYTKTYYKNLIGMINGGKRKIGCIFIDEGIFLHPLGDVYRCWAYDKKLGNIHEKSISTIWNENSNDMYKVEMKKVCDTCYNNCYVNFKRTDTIKRLLNKEEGLWENESCLY